MEHNLNSTLLTIMKVTNLISFLLIVDTIKYAILYLLNLVIIFYTEKTKKFIISFTLVDR